jgi:peptide/nickel transport system ATP-binding protein/oligopeptide transport system ATP-binding protein
MVLNNELLQVNNLKTYFYTAEGTAKAVDGVDFSVNSGEVLGIVGESGCGKSVTALSILRLIPEPPGEIIDGEILFQGKNLLALKSSQMRGVRGNSISMIFQEPMTSLNPVFRVGKQIAEAIRLHQHLSRHEARQKAVEMLKIVGIPSPHIRVREYPHQMSGGMRQRVMIAMAFSCTPKLLIADEPTTALDVTIQAQILELMNELKENMGSAIIFITHDLGVIAENAQRVMVMYAGKVVESASVQTIFMNPLHPYTIGLLQSIPGKDHIGKQKLLTAIPGIVPSLLHLPEGCTFCDRCPDVIPGVCSKEKPMLVEQESEHWVRCWKYQ